LGDSPLLHVIRVARFYVLAVVKFYRHLSIPMRSDVKIFPGVDAICIQPLERDSHPLLLLLPDILPV